MSPLSDQDHLQAAAHPGSGVRSILRHRRSFCFAFDKGLTTQICLNFTQVRLLLPPRKDGPSAPGSPISSYG
ncbi:rCG25707 [Rattus norvegicus]|uniref:RCG25707 n=1 Tax=Rattus norvegicus TaxID=10116 RepID=A6I3A2_RAT|nr:rCG25707 [Rattus norvegicus]